KDYDRSDGSENIIATTNEEFMARVPTEEPFRDPYVEEHSTAVTGGGDLRYVAYLPFGGTTTPLYRDINNSRAWLMEADLGARWRPIEDHLNVVMEGLFMTPPNYNSVDRTFTNEPR